MARRAKTRVLFGRWTVSWVSVAGIALNFLSGGDSSGQGTVPAKPPASVAPANPAPSNPAPTAQTELDQPLAWMKDAKRNYTAVQDYACMLVKKERVNGRLSEDHYIDFKFKQPHSVYMKWIRPSDFAGQEVAFVLGRNGNQMRVKSNKLGLKITGFHTIDPNDRRVLEHSRHNIFEAGIGNVIDHTIKAWESERQLNKTQVKTAEYNFNERRCIRIETTHPERHESYYAYRGVLYLDKDSKLPVRVESYDWPRAGGPAEGELLESFSYINLRFNVGLTDAFFNK